MREKIKILGVAIDNVSTKEAIEITEELIATSNKSCKLVVAPNTEFIMKAQKDEEFFQILNTADLATPDSVGVMIGGRLQKKRFKERIPGQTYFREILKYGEKKGWTFYVLGGKQEVLELAIRNLQTIFPKLNIVGYHEGYFVKDSEEEVVRQINEKAPNVLFVAMGAPLQEKWIAKHRKELQVDIAAGQGGTLDYESGRVKRAPRFVQNLCLEWLWRLILQPSRIVRMIVLPVYLVKICITKDITKGKFDK